MQHESRSVVTVRGGSCFCPRWICESRFVGCSVVVYHSAPVIGSAGQAAAFLAYRDERLETKTDINKRKLRRAKTDDLRGQRKKYEKEIFLTFNQRKGAAYSSLMILFSISFCFYCFRSIK